MLKIGVSACFMYPDVNRKVFGPKTLSYIENDMFAYLSSEGVMPILIPNLETGLPRQYLENIDGIVLQGGSDLSPQTYNEAYLDQGRWPGDRLRDVYEFKIMDWAVKSKIPVLGICRGAQLINAYFGGTLYQDIETQLPNSLSHRDALVYDRVKHKVELSSNGLLHKAYQQKEIHVNSVHHQGIKELGDGLLVEAVSPPDKIIEAIRHEELPILGVQWHPEFHHTIKEQLSDPQKILDIFYNFCKVTI